MITLGKPQDRVDFLLQSATHDDRTTATATGCDKSRFAACKLHTASKSYKLPTYYHHWKSACDSIQQYNFIIRQALVSRRQLQYEPYLALVSSTRIQLNYACDLGAESPWELLSTYIP